MPTNKTIVHGYKYVLSPTRLALARAVRRRLKSSNDGFVDKMSLENKHLSKCNHIVTIGSCSHSILAVNKVRFQLTGISTVEVN